MEKRNCRKIVLGLYVLFVLYYLIQGIIDEKYLFVMTATVGLIVMLYKYWNQSAVIEDRAFLETENDTYIIWGIIMWVSYNYLYKIEMLSAVTDYLMFAFWIVLLLLANILIDRLKQTPLIFSIHIKAIIAVLLVQTLQNGSGNMNNILVFGYFTIIGITYAIALKRVLIRDNKKTEDRLESLYRGSIVCLASYFVVAISDMEAARMLIYRPLEVVQFNWFFIVLLIWISAAKISVVKDQGRWMYFSQAGQILCVVLNLVMVKQEKIMFTLIGLIISCLLAEWLVNWMINSKYIKEDYNIVIIYLLYLPMMFIINDTFAKQRSDMMLVLMLSILVLAIVKRQKVHESDQSMMMFFLFLSYFIMLASKDSFLNINTLILLAVTAIIVTCYLKVSAFKKLKWIEDPSYDIHRKILNCILILLPLLVTVKNIQKDNTYLYLEFMGEYQSLSIGNTITGGIYGDEFSSVVLDWGNGIGEKCNDSSLIQTTIKSNCLIVTATDSEGNEHVYKKYYLLLDMMN